MRFLWYQFSFSFSKSSVGFSNTRWSRVMWWCILFFCVFHFYNDRVKDETYKFTLGSDGIGYYSYLPATFIYHDYSYLFTTRLSKKYREIRVAQTQGFCNSFNGKNVNKYFVGEAVALTPFFLVAHWLSGSYENPADGYSFYYMAAVSLGALFYLLLGLWAARSLLLRFGIKEGHVALVLFFIFFATNLFRYALGEEAMSHIYSFAFISLFVLVAHQLLEKFSNRKFFVLAFLFGFIIIIRPVNALVIFSLPFIAGDFSSLKLLFLIIFKRPLILLGGIIIFILMLFFQLGIYHEQCGKWFVYAYSKEGFNFLQPHFFSSLFSYSNGAFIYSPLLLVSLFGIFAFFKNEKFRFFSFLIFFCLMVWIISSWWTWTYAGAYGMRPFVEYYVFFALLLGFLIKSLAQKKILLFAVTVIVLFPLTVLSQIQIWQYKYGIIGYANMTKEKYWHVFLETRRQFYFINNEEMVVKIPSDCHLIFSDFVDYETKLPSMDWRSITTNKSFSGKHSILLKEENNHAPHWKKRIGDIISDSLLNKSKIVLGGSAKWLTEDNGTEARMVFATWRNDSIIYYNEMYIIHQVREENKWTNFKWNIDLPKFLPNDSIEIFPRRDNWFPVYIDDLKIDFYAH